MNSHVIALSASLMLLALPCFAATRTVVPLELPRPDEKPGNSQKPVKVYILAGQSNMVGMGDIAGARPPTPSVFLAADPAILPGRMPVGPSRKRGACRWMWRGLSGLATHGVYSSADPQAETGAHVALYKGAYDPQADYSKLEPVKTATVALGSVDATIPTLDGPSTPVVTAFLDVPVTGHYKVHVGFGASTHAIAVLDGKEVYRREPGAEPVVAKVTLEQGRRYPIRITYLDGGPVRPLRQAQGRSAALWLEQVDIEGTGDLVTHVKENGKFPYLIDDAGNWIARNDVWYKEARLRPDSAVVPLSATANGRSIGPELGFGFVMGTFHDEQVLVIKTAQGNRSLGYDFRPPSSERTSESEYEGMEYRLMIKGVRETLDNIADIVPGYAGQGYEVAGFGWFQGHKDSGSTKEAYEQNLVNLIQDVRKEFHAPEMPAVVAAVGFHGYRLHRGPWKGVWEAQMAVGDPEQHPELADTVAAVDTRDFWREVAESPRGQDYHYNRNPETYLLVGEAMGRAMVRLQGGEAAAIPVSDREAKTLAAMAAEAATLEPTAAQEAASLAAIRPMLLDGLLARFVSNPKTQSALQEIIQGIAKPEKIPAYLDDAMDQAVAYFQVAGVDTYDWKPFGGNLKDGTWHYFSYDLPNSPYSVGSDGAGAADEEAEEADDQAVATFELTWPSGMENWMMPGFDPKKAGWQRGVAPFGVQMAEMVPEEYDWIDKYPLYPLKRTLPETIVENDVLLLRKTIDVPPLKDGYRYRIRIDGSVHANSGEGYAIYVDGKLLTEQEHGVTAWRRQGLRGGHIWTDFRDAFADGKVTIGVANFPMRNWNPDRFIPPIGPLSVWMEEMKRPALGE